jgi:hypothetical protein
MGGQCSLRASNEMPKFVIERPVLTRPHGEPASALISSMKLPKMPCIGRVGGVNSSAG